MKGVSYETPNCLLEIQRRNQDASMHASGVTGVHWQGDACCISGKVCWIQDALHFQSSLAEGAKPLIHFLPAISEWQVDRSPHYLPSGAVVSNGKVQDFQFDL